MKNNSLVSLSALLQHFEKVKIIPDKIEAQVVKKFVSVLVKVQTSSKNRNTVALAMDTEQQERLDEQKNVLSFSDFVQIVGFMSAHVHAYAHRFMPHTSSQNNSTSRSQEGYHVGCHVIMQTVAEYFFRTALNKWLVYEFDYNVYMRGAVPSTPSQIAVASCNTISGDGGVINKALGMSPSSLLWICRQGNLIHTHSDLHSLYVHIAAATVQYPHRDNKSKKSVSSDRITDSSLVPTSKIPTLLATLSSNHVVQEPISASTVDAVNEGSHKLRHIIYQAENADFQYTQALIGSSDVATEASRVAMNAPGLFFASAQPLPSLLEALYSPPGARCVHLLASTLQRILAELDAERDHDGNFSRDAQSEKCVSLTKFVELLKLSSAVPILVSPEVVLKIGCYVLGRDVVCDSAVTKKPGSLLTEREFLDLVFACSQYIFGGTTETFSPTADSIILNRHVNQSVASNDTVEAWEWQTSLVNDSRLQRISAESKMPQLAMADRVDRLYCLLELLDPASRHLALIDRLNVNSSTEKKSKKLPFVIGLGQPPTLAERANDRAKISGALNLTQKKTQPRMLGRLLEFVFNESTKWAKLHSLSSFHDDSITNSAETMSFFQNVLIVIFLQYPCTVNSLALTPWDIAEMLSTSSAARNDSSYDIEYRHGFVNLIQDLRFICAKFSITVDDFERFLAFLVLTPIPKSTSSLSTDINYKLSISKLETFFPYLIDLFSPINVKLLQEGFPLLLWSYLCCTRGNGGHSSTQQWYIDTNNDSSVDYSMFDLSKNIPKKFDFSKVNPLMENVTASFPTRELYLSKKEFGVITLDAARVWALMQDIDSNICEDCFHLCVDVSNDSVLRFSNFIIFTVLCFYRQLNESNSQRKDTSYLSIGQATSKMLKVLSFNVHVHQQISTNKILALTVLGASTMNMSNMEEVAQLSTELFQQLQFLGKQRCVASGLGDSPITQSLPPRPPAKLWDAPRFIGFCKLMGLMPIVGSVTETWRLFGPVLVAAYPPASTQVWGGNVVGPLPIQVTVSKVCELLSSVKLEASSEPAGSMENLLVVIQHVIVPFLCGFFDDLISVALLTERKKSRTNNQFQDTYSNYITILNAFENSSSTLRPATASFKIVGIDDSVLQLEDILRYGGDRTIASLNFISPWVLDVYGKLRPPLSSLTESKLEPLSHSVTQFISSSSLLALSTVSIILKQSMSSRTRPVQFQSNGSQSLFDVGVSVTEFEEILIRCAFSFWCDVGALVMTMSDTVADSRIDVIIVQIFETMTSKYNFLSNKLISLYCEECRHSFFQNQDKNKKSFLPKRQLKSAFHASLNGAGVGDTEGRRSWGIDFLTPFCALLNETAIYSTSSGSDIIPTPSQAFKEPTRPVSLQAAIPPLSSIVDFQENNPVDGDEDREETKIKSVSGMLQAWGSDHTALDESKTFDATKGLHQMVEKATDSPSKPTINVQMEDLFNFQRKKVGDSNSGAFQAIPSKIRDSLSPPLRSSPVSPSPHSIVSRSEEMLAHILAMRGSTPLEHSHDQTPVSPLKSPVESIPATSPRNVVQGQQVKSQHTTSSQHKTSPHQNFDISSQNSQHINSQRNNAAELPTSPFSSSPFTFSPTSSSPSPSIANNDALLEGTKEALWPVFATYCSCGDSSEPGKLSGPNLFALLSKLDLLTDETMISDLGILLHQISAHSLSLTPILGSSSFSNGGMVEAEQSPLLSFEEFIVFLCAFAQLRFEGEVKLPSWTVSPSKSAGEFSKKEENWFAVCNSVYMSKSKSFKKLLEECVLPPLKKRLLLASPEDARHRDECSLIFSLETVFAIESVERSMLSLFKTDQRNMKRCMDRQGDPSNGHEYFEDPIVAALARIKIIPQIVSEHEVMQLIADILPSIHSNKTMRTSDMWKEMRFPQWQWVICVIAFKAVTFSIQKGQAEGKIKVNLLLVMLIILN